jgi:hypothetical protein
MKSISLFALALLLSAGLSAQSVQPSAKVAEAISAGVLEVNATPKGLAYLNFMADNLCIIQDSHEKAANLPVLDIPVSSDVTTASFNPLMYNIQPHATENQYYLIADGTKTLFVYSQQRLEVLYSRHTANTSK